MYPLPKYHPLDHPLLFEATIRTELTAGERLSETRISYPLTIGPAKQDWGPYCLSVQRGAATYGGYTPNNADKVVHLLGEPLHHLEITFDQEGSPLKLRNHTAIWKHWQGETAPVARSAYAGEWVEGMIRKTEQRLFNAPALLQTILHRDLILNIYLGLLRSGAGGSDEVLPFHISGVELHFQNTFHLITDAVGNTVVETAAEGLAPGGEEEWKKLLSVSKKEAEITSAPRIQRHCAYTLPAGSLWPIGFDCELEITNGEYLRKSIYLQLLLL